MLSFFIFLRWLFCLNLFISILLLCFVTLPNITIPRTNYTALNFTSLRENTNITDLEIKNLMLVENCSITYFNSVKVDSTTENYITSFFQGDVSMVVSCLAELSICPSCLSVLSSVNYPWFCSIHLSVLPYGICSSIHQSNCLSIHSVI